jgi:CheY-like chemotaxis protein
MTQPLDLILLVDDDETTNHVNKRLLSRLNVAREIKILANGQEAMNYLSRTEGSEADYQRPDLIFLDIKMPVMDGFSFLQAYEHVDIQQEEPIIILMLTSSASFYDLERLKSFPRVKKHISKALTEAEVKEIMRDYFSHRQ